MEVSIDLYPEFFNDVFGPVMQPGSSSHTAAPCRLGYLASNLLGEPPVRMQVVLDRQGSFAGTFGTMAEDRAMVAGALGLLPDDERLFHAFALAEAEGVEVAFVFADVTESLHPNAMRFVLTGASGRTVTLVGNSIGGGMIETVAADGYSLRVRGDTYVLLVFTAGAVAAEMSPALAERLCDVLDAGVSRRAGGGALHWYRLAGPPDIASVVRHVSELMPATGQAATAGRVGPRVALLRPVLPVITQLDRKPQLFDTMTRWRELAVSGGSALWEVAVQYEVDASQWSAERVLSQMRELAAKMDRQTRAAYDDDVTVPQSPFKPDFSGRWTRHAASPARLTDDLTAQTIRWAYGAGAGIPGVETVPGPMGSGGGYIYAALSAVRDARGLTDDDLLHGLLVAAGIGAIAFTRTDPTGEVIGCTGEAGMCGAMAAAAIVEMVGGTAAQAENAASLALQAFTGMPCDPMPGGLCQPCRSRILTAACMAHVFADLAMAGHDAVLPLHEAIDVADAVGRRLPADLLCTSRGGACAAPAAQAQAASYCDWLATTRPEDRPPGNLI
ncbi:MAG: L-serine ammonia-lyase, iron-sulfur-dependent, subunit alpha [Thermoleophilia bacterium]